MGILIFKDLAKILLLDQLIEFTQIVGHKINGTSDIDIVQLLLQYSNYELLYEKAKGLARDMLAKLYLEWM